MPDSLIISPNAQALEAEIKRLSEKPIMVTCCATASDAIEVYRGQPVVFGRPDLIAEALPEMPDVQWVQSSWAGVEPLVALSKRDYSLTIIKDVFGPQMSEYVFGFLLAQELKLIERQKHQVDHHWFDSGSGRLEGKRIGIMGTGSIGRHIAKTAQCFSMNAVGLSRTGAAMKEFSQVLTVDQIDRFLGDLDYLVAALPRTPGTDHLLNANTLALLPDHAYLVNIGRSNVIDTSALIDALNDGTLAGAALDVFDTEPVPDDSPLWDTPNLSITAHIAAASYPSLIVPIFLENYRRFINGDSLKNQFDFDAGY